jgi:radical SAM protein with 4Fe4S-binding SPASM domain
MRKILKYVYKGTKFISSHPKSWWRIVLNEISAIISCPWVPCLPTFITIEPTNICDMHCPICETGSGILNRKRGSISFDNYKIIIDKIYKHTNYLIFYFMGEPFLNKDAYRMISYAKKKGIFVSTCTNGHFIDAETLLESEIDEINFQIGGATQGTHKIYRIGGDLDTTLENMREVIKSKRESNGRFKTHIALGFIVMKHNEEEIEEIQKIAHQAGVDEFQIISPCLRTVEQAYDMLPANRKYWIYDESALRKGKLIHKNRPRNKCWWLWHSTVITWSGDVLPCCRDPHGELVMGNIFQSNLKDIWNNSKYITFRKKILRDQLSISMCSLCSGFGV